MNRSSRTRLVDARKHRQWSQQELANLLGTTQHNVSRWERGQTTPGSYFRAKLCELFGISAQELDLITPATDEEQSLEQLPTPPPAHEIPAASFSELNQPQPFWHVPYSRNPFFTGREALVKELHTRLHGSQTIALSQSHVVYGLGGIGKTQLAIEYAYRHAQDYTAVLWITAETSESILASLQRVTTALALPPEQDQLKLVASVRRWLESHRDWLLIWDNVEDLDLLNQFFPPTREGAVLLTTRRQALGTFALGLELAVLEPEEGMLLLLRRAKLLALDASSLQLHQLAQQQPVEFAAAEEIVQQLDRLPLALDQAGAYIESAQCSLSDYLLLLQSSPLRLLAEREVYADHPLSVTQTFTLIFARLEQSSVPAAELLTACAFLTPDAIPEDFFLEGAAQLGPTFEALAVDPFQFQAVMKALLMYSLVQRNIATRTLTIHRLVQAVLKGRLSEAIRQDWVARVIRAMSKIFPPDEHTANYLPACEKLLPHALMCLASGDRRDADIEDTVARITLLNRVGSYLSQRANSADAEAFLQHALHLGEQMLGVAHPLVAETLHELADFYREQGKFEQAEPLFQRALHIWEQVLELNDLRVASSLNGLGVLCLERNRLEEAEPLFQRALSIREQLLGMEHPLVAKTLNGLANIYRARGELELAESLYQRILHVREHTLGSNHPLVAISLNNLAVLYEEQGKYELTESLYRRALHIQEQVWGSKHPEVAYPLHNLAILYKKQGKYELAESLYRRALHIRERALSPEHPLIAYPLHNLAELYRIQGKDTEAEPLYQRALLIWEQALGSEHPLVAHPLIGLADLYRMQNNYPEAEAFYERALCIQQQAAPGHSDTADALDGLAALREARGEHQEAASLYQRALAIREQVLGPEHPETVEAQARYTTFLQTSGLYDASETDFSAL